MSKVYCFNVENPEQAPLDVEALKRKIRSFYTGKEPKFPGGELPFVVTFTSRDSSVCIHLTKKGKKVVERIEAINKKLTARSLKFGGLKLTKPYVFGVDSQDWFLTGGSCVGGQRWTSLLALSCLGQGLTSR